MNECPFLGHILPLLARFFSKGQTAPLTSQFVEISARKKHMKKAVVFALDFV